MAKIIHVDFSQKKRIENAIPETPSLKEAKVFLGNTYFRKALLEWSEEELLYSINHPEAVLSGASEHYFAIYNFKKSKNSKRCNLRVIRGGIR